MAAVPAKAILYCSGMRRLGVPRDAGRALATPDDGEIFPNEVESGCEELVASMNFLEMNFFSFCGQNQQSRSCFAVGMKLASPWLRP